MSHMQYSISILRLDLVQLLAAAGLGHPIPTPHLQSAGISDSATRPSAGCEDELVIQEF